MPRSSCAARAGKDISRPQTLMVMLPRLRQAADSFWHLLGGSSDIADAPHLSASKVAHLEACLAAALGASERRQSLESERVAREEAKSLIAKAKALASAEESALKAAKHMAMQRG